MFSLLVSWVLLIGVNATGNPAIQTQADPRAWAPTLDLIYRLKYNEAITRLEQVLEKSPGDGEALTYLATANLYHDLNFTKAQKEFTEAFKAGGGATFFVTHSHEKLNTEDVVDYCRGWLHLRGPGVEFVPNDGSHGFKIQYHEIEEFKRNRLSKKYFHIKFGGKSQNFRGRSNSDLEPLLIIALYKNFARIENTSAADTHHRAPHRRTPHHEKTSTAISCLATHVRFCFAQSAACCGSPGGRRKRDAGKTAD